MIQDVVEDIDKGVLSREEYPYLKEPSGSAMHSSSPSSRPPTAPHSKPVQSMRTTAKGPGTTWASRGRASSDDGYSRFASCRRVSYFMVHFLVSI